MIFPLHLSMGLVKYIIGNRLWPNKRMPMLVILEPTLRCNLTCVGCGRIRDSESVQDRLLTVEQCLEAADKTGAPVACISGGEPLLHPEISGIASQLVRKRRHVYLATNGLLLEKFLSKVKPSPYLNFVVHIDGLAETHDKMVGLDGAFDVTIEAVKAARRAGFQVYTNTTFYRGTDLGEVEQLFTFLTELDVSGIMIVGGSPFNGEVEDIYLSRQETGAVFRHLYQFRDRFKYYSNPLYLKFLTGERELRCTPWACPTLSPLGWRQPCYALTDGYCESLAELVAKTDWDNYGTGKDPRCANCMFHNPFETSATLEAGRSLSTLWELARWNLSR
jgi:hopanoid biosynthesis associated radical SAM protein HpnH